MKNLLLSHVGLGDMFICNGLVRTLADRLGQICVIALPDYYESVRFMFSDEPRIEVIKLHPMDRQIDDLEFKRKHLEGLLDLSNYNEIAIGFLHKSLNVWHYPSIDQGFYGQLGLPFHYKWSEYKAPRFNVIDNVQRKPYVFVHEDPSRNLLIDSLPSGLDIVRPSDFSFRNIFMYENLIRGASEIHVIDSAFSNFIEHLHDLTMPKYLYDAKHISGGKGFPVYRNKWNLVIDLKNKPNFVV